MTLEKKKMKRDSNLGKGREISAEGERWTKAKEHKSCLINLKKSYYLIFIKVIYIDMHIHHINRHTHTHINECYATWTETTSDKNHRLTKTPVQSTRILLSNSWIR